MAVPLSARVQNGAVVHQLAVRLSLVQNFVAFLVPCLQGEKVTDKRAVDRLIA